ARNPVRRERAADGRDGGAGPRTQARSAARDRRRLPRARADDADADRRRGHALARRRIARAAPPPRLACRSATMARVRVGAPGGPSFDLELIGEILGDELADAAEPARWQRLAELVVSGGDGTLTFRHDLMRATAYEGLSFRRRREIHGRVGLALEARAGERADE